jgi:hypothetical protein
MPNIPPVEVNLRRESAAAAAFVLKVWPDVGTMPRFQGTDRDGLRLSVAPDALPRVAEALAVAARHGGWLAESAAIMLSDLKHLLPADRPGDDSDNPAPSGP